MPITAKFSREFYDKFGHEAVDELVDFLNRIDSAYRSELAELNEQNFSRFDDKLERRAAELRATIDVRAAELNAKIDERTAKIDVRCQDLDTKIGRVADQIRAEIALQMRDQVKWMFIFWAGTLVPLAGLILALGKGWI